MNLHTGKTLVEIILLFCFGIAVNAQSLMGGLLDELWTRTINDATTNAPLVREWAAYITLDTADGKYALTEIVHGDWSHPNDTPNASIPQRPPDDPPDPNPIEPAVYPVAWIHTHPPTTYLTNTIDALKWHPVGPSKEDKAASIHPLVNVPGFVIDYMEDPSTPGFIPAGHPMDAPIQLYPITPPERRPTP